MWSLPVKEECMSEHEHEIDRRECSRCGALLSMWFCDACGSDSFDSITEAYVAELATPWRTQEARPATASVAV